MSTVETVETKVFEPAELFAQLSRLLTLYLARAEDSDALANMAPKDALTCAKTVMALMADLQGGKPASVDEHTEWPRLEMAFTAGGAGVSPVIPRRRGTGPRPTGHPLSPTPISSLEDAIVAVCHADEETQALEPWARLVARIDELCIHIQSDLDAWRESGGAEAAEPALSLSKGGSNGENVDNDWDPGDNGDLPDESCIPSSFQLIESASSDEASENDNGNNTDFPARRNPRGP